MQLAHPFIRLPAQFDAERLREEVNAIPESAWNPHPQGFPGNSALLLIARDGNSRDDALSGAMLPTPNLQALPYLNQVLASFNTTFGRTRLMRIDGNAEANWHMDANYYWHQRVRLHVPIQTNESVRFHCGDADVHMRAGESWIFDTWRMHNVFNPHPDRRIHLVADTTGSAHFWQQVARGLAQPGAAGDWQPDPVMQWNPAIEPNLLTERYNTPEVMSPWEMRYLSERILKDVPNPLDEVAQRASALVEAFISDWHCLWSHYGPDPAVASYRQRRDQFAEDVKALPELALNNKMGLQNMLCQALVYPAVATAAAAAAPAPVAATTTASQTRPPEPEELFDRPVFIVAAPRSGSSWLFETLSQSAGLLTLGGEGHGQIESIGPLNPRQNQRWHNALDADDASEAVVAQLKANYLAGLRTHQGEPVQAKVPFRFLEKTPKNALRIGFLKKAFPKARFIWLHRDPKENIASIIEAWGSGRFVTYPQLPDWSRPWSLLLPPGWQALKDKPTGQIAAWQWATTNDTILSQLQQLADDDWTQVSYQQLCQDTESTLQQLWDFIGVDAPAAPKGDVLSQHTLTPPSPDKWRKHESDIESSRDIWQPIEQRIHGLEQPAAPAATPTSTEGELPMSQPDDSSATDTQEPLDFSSVFTTSLPPLLRQGGFSLLVTTYQAGKLIVVRQQDNQINTHFKLFRKPMGLCGDINKFALGSLNQIQEFRNMPAAAPFLPADTKHDAVYVPRQTHITGDIDIHEMAFDGDNRLWFVNTRFSCLCVRDFDHSFVPMWRPPFVSAYAPEDRCHLNGLAMRDGKPRYVTMLGKTDSKGGWRENKRNGGLLMDISDNRIIAEGLSMPHSPRWYRNTLWVLESGEGSLSKVDLASGKLEHVCKLPGFTRGLDFVGDYAFIGLSQVRESAIFSGLPLTERDEPRQCGVWVVNIVSGETVAFLRFEGSVQEIFSVQPIMGARFPEVLENDHPLVSTCYALPDDALTQVDYTSIEQARAEAAAKKNAEPTTS
ncbi:TIGR03032 family protein [Alcanivorax sp. 1008]|uniref:TIGR03032 family protein n=1 Tax=Alcanivorax sp. 1008 TaxID=2816853 RepID=UPI001DC7ABD6|nr:TIGR03032 family protein [Alcanivorax sp. 1008]MCC1497897.1 TIGR03032 family protein [Alcanivorax sp. 1008]